MRITLFDGEKQPISGELSYDPDMSIEEQGVKKLSIYVGDDVCGGNIMVPLGMLMGLINFIAEADINRSGNGLIVPPKKLILPN